MNVYFECSILCYTTFYLALLYLFSLKDGRPKSKGVHKVRTNVYINVLDEDDNGAKFDSNYSKPIIEGEYTVCAFFMRKRKICEPLTHILTF